jgi:hypothetical protein
MGVCGNYERKEKLKRLVKLQELITRNYKEKNTNGKDFKGYNMDIRTVFLVGFCEVGEIPYFDLKFE